MAQDKAYILILDDDPINLYLLKKILESEDSIVPIPATTGEEAIQLLGEREYALAIIDLQLPDIHGLEVIRRMRENETLRETPILIITAIFKDEESINKAYELGVADYIFKPLSAEILLSKVTLFAKHYVTRKALEKSQQLLKKQNIEISESRKYYRALIEYMPAGLVVYESLNNGADFIIKDMNPTAEMLGNVTLGNVRGKRVTEVFPGIVETGLVDVFRRVWKTGINEQLPQLIYTGARGERYYENNIYKQPSGELVAVFNDISDRVQAEQELQRNEANLARTQHIAHVGSWELDLDTMELYWTDETYRIHDLGPDFIPTLENALNYYEPHHRPAITEAVKLCIEESESFDLELEIVTAKGRRVWVRALGEPVYDNNRIIKIGGTFQDISEQKARIVLAEQAREKYEQLYGSIRDAILIADKDRRIIDMNRAFSDLFGYSLDDLKGKQTVTVYKNESEYELLGELIRQMDKPSDSSIFTIHYRKKSGEVFPGETALYKIYDTNGNVTGFMGLIRDVSEKEDLERQLANARKLESIGQLAAGVAHEINTPIMYISGNLQFLQESFESILHLLEKQNDLYISVKKNQDGSSFLPAIEAAREAVQLDFLLDEIPRAIADSQEGTDRISHIVQAMKKFSHMGIGSMESVNVNDAVENTITIASNEWKYDSEMVTDFAKDLPPIEGVLGDFNQAILNVLVNAAHANSAMVKKSGGKGTIRISTALDGDFVKLCISDTGAGIPADNQHKIFDPFFTTKEVGEGTGQGLSIAHTIVKKHGGTISFKTKENMGTTFFLRFPIKQKSRPQDGTE